MALSNIITSPQVVCYINSLPFARCSYLTYDVTTARKEVKVVDTLQPVEFVPTQAAVRGTIQVYRLHQDGGAEAAGLVATFDKLTKEKYFALLVKDRLTDTVLAQVDNCVVQSHSWRIAPRSHVVGTITWSGFKYSNDAE